MICRLCLSYLTSVVRCLGFLMFFCFFFFLMIRRPPRSTLFPYTTSSDLSAAELAAALRKSITPLRRGRRWAARSEEHTSELQSHHELVCRLLLEKKNDRGDAPARVRGRWRAAGWLGVGADAYLFLVFGHAATTENYTLSLHDALPI